VNNQFQGDLTSSGLSEAADGASQEGGVSAVRMAAGGHTRATAVPASSTPCLCQQPHICLRASVPLVERQKHENERYYTRAKKERHSHTTLMAAVQLLCLSQEPIMVDEVLDGNRPLGRDIRLARC